MGKCCEEGSCCPPKKETCSCCCHEHHHHHEEESCDKSSYFLRLADEAWSEVLKEKIKEHILSTQEKRMNELAKIISEGNNERWKLKMEKKNGCIEFEEKLCDFFSKSKK
jgi:hypothetical protein